MKNYHMLRPSDIKITGGILGEKRRLIAGVTVPYIGNALCDEVAGIRKSGSVENFRIASGEVRKEFHGLVSQDSDLFKWMEAASLALAQQEENGFLGEKGNKETPRNMGLRARLKELADLLERCQMKDGYLNTYYIINGLKHKWSYLKESCQLYCAGHLLEAAVTNYEVTGERSLLEIAMKYGDCIDRAFGAEEGKIHGYDGHAEIELALYRLYEATGMDKYRDLADFFVEERGKQPYFFNQEKGNVDVTGNLVYELKEDDFHHSQSHLPVREQKEAVGHAVKAAYFYTAAADKARLSKDEKLYETVEGLWEDVTEKKMFLTGAIGSSEYGESFTYAYDLPGDLMYGETCAAIGLFLWGYHMLRMDTDRKYSDVMERALFNGILGGISEDGKKFFYTNPLEIDPERCKKRKDYSHLETERQSWFDCPCCPPNIARLILSFNRYMYTASLGELNIHFFASSAADIEGWHVEQRTEYPAEGKIMLTVERKGEGKGRLRIRVPGWCENFIIKADGKKVEGTLEKGYLLMEEDFSHKKIIELDLDMPLKKVYANGRVKSLAGKAAVMRGPLVYCLEQADNGELFDLFFKETGKLEMGEDGTVLAEGYRMAGPGSGLYTYQKPDYREENIILLPYYRWNNRGAGQMRVFLGERGYLNGSEDKR